MLASLIEREIIIHLCDSKSILYHYNVSVGGNSVYVNKVAMHSKVLCNEGHLQSRK